MKIKAYEIKDLVEREKYAGYLVYGQNKGLIREKSKTIINFYKNDETEIIKFENDELISEPGKLSNEFNTFSLTAKKKILHILNTKDNLTEIITNTVIDDQNSINLIVFETGELTPRSKLRKFFEKEKHLGILACYFDTEHDVRDLIETTFRKEDMLINRDISLLIAKHLGNERHIIKSELEKIILYLKDKKEFKAEDILKCLSQNEDFGFDDNYKVEVKSLKDIDTWAKLDPKDYKRVYTNAYQRLAHRRRLKKLSKRRGVGMTIGSSKNHI